MKRKLIKKALPHNFLAEQMILSCLLLNSETIKFTIKLLPIQAFYFKNHQEIYKILIFMNKNQLYIDMLAFTTFLQENGLIQRIGGIQVLLELTSYSSNPIHLEEYIQVVKEKFLRRSLIQIGYKIITSSYVTNIGIHELLDKLEFEISNLTNKNNNTQTLNSTELLNKIFIEVKERFLNPKLPGLESGFENLDSLTQGFQNSDLIIFAGRPSIGKTALSLNLALNILKNSRLPVLFFSLEMSKEQLMYRILAFETNINQRRLKNGKLYQNDWVKLTKVIKIISKLPLFIDDTTNLSIQDLRLKIKSVLLKESQLGLVIIDYLQLMEAIEFKSGNRVQELSYITRSLKNLAREFNIPIIALSQLNRTVENRIDQKPVLSDLRESGSIEQDADLVLMLYRLKFENSSATDLTELIIAKHRNGSTGSVKFKFNKSQTKFIELNN